MRASSLPSAWECPLAQKSSSKRALELLLQEMPLWKVHTRNLLWESGIHSLLSQTMGLVKKHLPAWLPLLLGLTEERMELRNFCWELRNFCWEPRMLQRCFWLV